MGGGELTPGIREGGEVMAATGRERFNRGEVGTVNRYGRSPSEKDQRVSSLSSRKGEEKEEMQRGGAKEKNDEERWIRF